MLEYNEKLCVCVLTNKIESCMTTMHRKGNRKQKVSGKEDRNGEQLRYHVH